MIPTMLLVGLVFGRWWKVAVPVGAIAWAALLVATGVDSGLGFVVGAGALGAANVTVGVLINRGIARAAGLARQSGSH